jgi:hypothetical protein
MYQNLTNDWKVHSAMHCLAVQMQCLSYVHILSINVCGVLLRLSVLQFLQISLAEWWICRRFAADWKSPSQNSLCNRWKEGSELHNSALEVEDVWWGYFQVRDARQYLIILIILPANTVLSCFKPLKHTGNYMYHLLDIKQLYFLLAQYVLYFIWLSQ